MSLWKSLVVTGFVCAGISPLPARAADPSSALALSGCPPHLAEGGKFHMLAGMRVFDGVPNHGPEVIPDVSGRTSTWDIDNVRAAGTEPGVLCSFKHTGRTLVYTVPKGARTCTFTSGYPAQSTCR